MSELPRRSTRRCDAHIIAPFRVEWRTDLTTRWLLIENVQTHDDAMRSMDETHARYGGQARIVGQHVSDAKGLVA